MTIRHAPATVCVLLTSWLSAAESTAASTPAGNDFASLDLEDLMRVSVVTPTRNAADPFVLPFTTRVFDRAARESVSPRTLPEWLDRTPGIMIQKTSHAQQSPYIRGFTGFRTLMLIDGVRLNNAVFRDGPNQYWNTIDPLSLDRIELVAGPASVLYGSDSVGGTAQAITPVTDLAAAREWTAQFSGRYASAEHSLIGRVAANGPVGTGGHLSLGYSAKDFGDYEPAPPLPRQAHTGYTESAIDAKYEQRLGSRLRLSVLHQSFGQDDAWRTHSTPFASSWYGTTTGNDRERSFDQVRQLSYVRLDADNLDGAVERAEFVVSHHRQVERASRIRSNGRSEHSRTAVDSYGLRTQLLARTFAGLWTAGLTGYRDLVSSQQDRFLADGTFERADVQGQVADDSTYELASAYVQNELPAWGPFSVTARARHDRIRVQAGRFLDTRTNLPASLSKRWSSTIGSLHGTYALPRAGERENLVFAGISQGFRAPNLSDLSRLDSSAGNRIETPSPSLLPEEFLMSEIGFKTRSPRLQLNGTFYHTTIDRLIIRRPTGQQVLGMVELTKLNSGEGFVRGVELESLVALTPTLTFRLAGSWMEGEVTTFPSDDPNLIVDETISRLAPLTTHASLRWRPAHRRLTLEAAATLAGSQRRLSESDRADTDRIPPGGTPGYSVVHLRAVWDPSPFLSITAGVQNLTNVDYRIHGSGENEPGRNYLLAFTLRR